MDGSFHFLSHEQFASLLPPQRTEYLDRAVLELERRREAHDFSAQSDVKTIIVWQIPSGLESYL